MGDRNWQGGDQFWLPKMHGPGGPFLAADRFFRYTGLPIMNESHELLLVDLLLTKPAIYLRELQHELYTSTGIVIHL